jgi:hypothetical protein
MLTIIDVEAMTMKQLQELAIVKNQQNKKHKRLRRRKGAS